MPNPTPSRRRWLILGIIFSAVVLNYVDRQILSILKPTLKQSFAMDDRGYATIVNVFTACYAVVYPIAGWLADRFGARILMLVGISGWSIACLGCGFSSSLRQLTFSRGVLGVFEPMAFPAQLRVVTVWFPGTLRATANSLCVAGSSIGAIIAPPLIAWITLHYGWHTAFIVPGAVGLALAVLWIAIYRDPPAPVAELASDPEPSRHDTPFTWPQLWKTRSLWGILLCRFLTDPVWYFCLFWLPGYLQEQSGLSLKQIGLVGWIPFLVADLGGVGSAAWSDSLVRHGVTPLRARKIMLACTAALAPICILTPHLPSAVAVLAIFSIVGAVCLSWLFSLSVVIAETFPADNVGSVLGIAAGFGAAGAIIFNDQFGKLMDTVGPASIFAAMAVLHPLAAVILWAFVRPETAITARPSPLL